jgi:hypothetical protein
MPQDVMAAVWVHIMVVQAAALLTFAQAALP